MNQLVIIEIVISMALVYFIISTSISGILEIIKTIWSNDDVRLQMVYDATVNDWIAETESKPGTIVDFQKNIKEYKEGVRKYLENKLIQYGFVGIKIYPSLGYYPFHPALEPVYEFASQYNLPVMTHCTRAGVWFRGKLRQQHVLPENMNPNPVYKYDFTSQLKAKNRHFKDNFAKPENFVEVLEMEKFENLKICFGHYGGADEILNSKNQGHNTVGTNFYLNIKALMDKYDNVYTDISYSLSEINKIKPYIEADLQNPRCKNRIMFGTDFFLTLQENTEQKLIDNCIKNLTTLDFNQIAITNTREYLTSEYYKP